MGDSERGAVKSIPSGPPKRGLCWKDRGVCVKTEKDSDNHSENSCSEIGNVRTSGRQSRMTESPKATRVSLKRKRNREKPVLRASGNETKKAGSKRGTRGGQDAGG